MVKRRFKRLITGAERDALKAATRRAYAATGETQAEIALYCRLDQQALSRAASAEHADRFLPIDAAVEVMRQAGTADVLRAMSRMLGWALVPLPNIDAAAACSAEAARTISELGEFLTELGVAMADDGAVGDLSELDRVIPAAEEGQESLAALIEAMKRRREELLPGSVGEPDAEEA